MIAVCSNMIFLSDAVMYLCIQNILFQIFIKSVARRNNLLLQMTNVLQEPKILEFDT